MKSKPWGGHITRMNASEVLVSAGVPAGPATVGAAVSGVLGDAGRLAARAQLTAGASGLRAGESPDCAQHDIGDAAGGWVDEPACDGSGGVRAVLGMVQDAELEETLDLVAFAQARLGAARLGVACEVAARGLHTEAGFSLPDWLQLRCPDLDAPVTRDLSRIALASREAVHEPLVAAVLSGRMSLARAARIHRALSRIRKAVGEEEYAAAVALLVTSGCNPVFDEKDIAQIITELLKKCLPEKDHEERKRAKAALGDIHESSLADGSVKRLIWTFGDDADYEAVRAILMSPLSAPASKKEQEATGEVDTRTPGQRRYDAMMTVVRRGVAGTKGQPTTPKAMVVVTIDYETLRKQLVESVGDILGESCEKARAEGLLAPGQLPGAGTSLDGTRLIPASTIRRLACDADIIPMVLGGPTEILDQAERKRLVTPGQRLRLSIRDGGCTIPGCGVPATWCDAHHIVHWAHGGPSDLANYALLCPRHHAWVHKMGLTASIIEDCVVWHMR